MKGIIIYKSKYGSTKKYAEWLKEATGFEMVEADKAKIDEAARCDTKSLAAASTQIGRAHV